MISDQHRPSEADVLTHAETKLGRSLPAGWLDLYEQKRSVAVGVNVLGYGADSDEQTLRRAGAETFYSFDALPGLLGL